MRRQASVAFCLSHRFNDFFCVQLNAQSERSIFERWTNERGKKSPIFRRMNEFLVEPSYFSHWSTIFMSFGLCEYFIRRHFCISI